MAQELHPAVKRIFDPNKYVCRPSVEIFTEHSIRGKDGKEIKVGKEDLEQFAKVNNEKAAKGALSTVGAGHTFDDQYDKDGNLEKKFPEEKQPTPLGFLYRYEVKFNPHTQKWSLYADEHIEKYIKDPETGQMVDGLKYTASFPRRSAEAYHNEKWIDHVAMIRRAPRLDLGVVAYAKNDPAHALYSKDKDGKELYAYQFARGKVRYSFDTGEGTMEPNDQSPAAPATAEANPEQDAAEPGVAEEGLPPEHMEAAEQYARHSSGMHHSQMKRLMGHLHQKYAKECGLPEDMNMEYSMGSAGPAVVPNTASAAPNPTSNQQKPEMTRMQKDQFAIEKERYEKRFLDLETELASTRQKELYTHMERHLLQLVHEGFPIDASKELELCQSRKYSREKFDEYIGDIKRLGSANRAPIGDLPPLAPFRDYQVPGASAVDDSGMTTESYREAQKYMRQQGCSWEKAKEKYSKKAS